MIKLTSLEALPIYLSISAIEGVVQHEKFTHIITKRWDYNVLETAEQVYEQLLNIDGTELDIAKNWFTIHAKNE